MPIEYRIDHEKRLVLAKAKGTLIAEDIFGYQRTVWSMPEVAGYNELVDMSEVEHIHQPSPERIQELAKLSAKMDTRSTPSKFAIVAPTDFAFGLGRMYEAHRALDNRSTKQVSVFRTMEEALAFLGTEGISAAGSPLNNVQGTE